MNLVRVAVVLFAAAVASASLDRHGGMDGGPRRDGFAVTPGGRVWMGDTRGTTYVCKSFGAGWSYGGLRYTPGDSPLGWISAPNISQIHFFDERRGLLAGYISSGSYGPQDTVYTTEDGGKTFIPGSFGKSMWVYGLQAESSGQVWMVGSSGDVVHSEDFGKTWKAVTAPYDSTTRSSSIVMMDTKNGFVSAVHNGLKRTRDGGKTWSAEPTPRDQSLTPDDGKSFADYCDHRITLVRLGSKLVARQCGVALVSDMTKIHWVKPSPVLPTGVVDKEHTRLVGFDEKQQLVAVNDSLSPVVLAKRLAVPNLTVEEAQGDQVFFRDAGDAVYRWSPTSWTVQLPALRGETIAPPGDVRMVGSKLWGWTAHNVYGSDDHATSWFRIAYSSGVVNGLVAFDDETALVWDRHGNNRRLRRASSAMEPIPALSGYDITGVVQRGNTFLAYGGCQFETLRAPTTARTTYSGQFVGSRPDGFVLKSTDRGQTWSLLDTWKGCGVARAFLDRGGVVTLYSYRGAVRQLSPQENGYVTRDLSVTEPRIGQPPYVEFASALWFKNSQEGYIAGTVHEAGRFAYRSTDGGSHWRSVDGSTWPYTGTSTAPDFDIAWNDDEVVALRGDEREVVFLAPTVRTAKDPAQETKKTRVTYAEFDKSIGDVLVTFSSGSWDSRIHSYRRFRKNAAGAWVEH